MTKKLTNKSRQRLIADIVAALQGPVELCKTHGLSLDDLALWIGDPQNQRTLSGVCVFSDLQAQVLLSRYRLHAAGRLIKLATEDQEGVSRDVARRACVDLLKMDLKRADFEGADSSRGRGQEAEAGHEDRDALRRLLYHTGPSLEALDNDAGRDQAGQPIRPKDKA